MSEGQLRWRGRLGALKPATALGALVGAVLAFAIYMGPLATAQRNPGGPYAATLGQVVSGEVGSGRYVTLAGTAIYGAGITESDDNGKLTGFVYPLANWDEGALVYVRSDQPAVDAPKNDNEDTTVTGILGSTPSSIVALIMKDLPDITDAGLSTVPEVMLVVGRKPGNAGVLGMAAVVLAILALLCAATLFVPYPAFGKAPVEPSATPAELDRSVKATGRFLRLKSIDPNIEVGRGTRMFQDAVGNIITLDGGRLMIYVQQVIKSQGGATLATSHWARFPEPQRVTEIDSGKLYGWKDRPAVRLRSRDMKARSDDLLLAFNHSAAQAEFLRLLQQLGFRVNADF